MLPVDANRNTGPCRGQDGLQRGEIPRMHDIRLQSPEQAPESYVEPPVVPGALVQREDFDVVPLDSILEARRIREANDGMAVSVGGHVIDEIDETVLHPPDIEPMDHMRDEHQSVSDSEDNSLSKPSGGIPPNLSEATSDGAETP